MANTLKQQLAANRLTVGSWITLAHPAIAEIMARAGFDWLTVDMEHSVITIREAEELIRVVSLCNVPALVRLTSNNADLIKRVMDAGASGVIVPMVNSRVDAENAVSAVNYPPLGRRGVGLARAQGYGPDFAAYREWLGSGGAVVMVMIEHIDAVRNLREILTVPGVDGYFIGPYDLSSSMGLAGQLEHPDVVHAIEQVRATAKALGKPGGVHVIEPEPEKLRAFVGQGFTFLAYSLDMRMLDRTAREGLDSIAKERSK
jgi:2-dehydro-3-deoxyglucarate aldolase